MPEPAIDDERFTALRHKFAALGRQLSDAQLLALADTYHEILRLRRSGRGWRERFERLGAPAEEARSFQADA